MPDDIFGRQKRKIINTVRRLVGVSALGEELHRQTERLAETRNMVAHLSNQIAGRGVERAPLLDGHTLRGFEYPYVAKERKWERAPFIRRLTEGFERSKPAYAELLTRFATLAPKLADIAADEVPGQACWNNPWFSGLDAVSLYGLLALNNPETYLEIGSGYSTTFARRAVRDHGLKTKIISVDPQPRREVDAACDQVIREPLEKVDPEIFSRLTARDILFVDSSHRSFQNSDVTVFFVEILGMLPPGLLYGIHDILLPSDYCGGFVENFYNEQYLLAAYLAGGASGDSIELPVYWASYCEELKPILQPLWDMPNLHGVPPVGGSFWLRKG